MEQSNTNNIEKRSIKVKLYLNIGLVADQQEIIEITEDEVDLDDQTAIEEYLDQYIEDWKNNYLEYGYEILESRN